jgi:hypothetical protein
MDLFNTNFEVRSNKDVNEEYERIFNGVTISKQEQISVELATREQSGCEEWEQQRSGRITGTKVHRIVKRDPGKETLLVVKHSFFLSFVTQN